MSEIRMQSGPILCPPSPQILPISTCIIFASSARGNHTMVSIPVACIGSYVSCGKKSETKLQYTRTDSAISGSPSSQSDACVCVCVCVPDRVSQKCNPLIGTHGSNENEDSEDEVKIRPFSARIYRIEGDDRRRESYAPLPHPHHYHTQGKMKDK